MSRTRLWGLEFGLHFFVEDLAGFSVDVSELFGCQWSLQVLPHSEVFEGEENLFDGLLSFLKGGLRLQVGILFEKFGVSNDVLQHFACALPQQLCQVCVFGSILVSEQHGLPRRVQIVGQGGSCEAIFVFIPELRTTCQGYQQEFLQMAQSLLLVVGVGHRFLRDRVSLVFPAPLCEQGILEEGTIVFGEQRSFDGIGMRGERFFQGRKLLWRVQGRVRVFFVAPQELADGFGFSERLAPPFDSESCNEAVRVLSFGQEEELEVSPLVQQG